MPRNQKERIVFEPPNIEGMKPIGIYGQLLESISLSIDEYEAIRLADYENMEQVEAAQVMGVSRPTFTRLIKKAHQKIAEAIVGVKVIRIEGGNFSFRRRKNRCLDCGHITVFEEDETVDEFCPDCKSQNIISLNDKFGCRGKGQRKGQGHGKRGNRGRC